MPERILSTKRRLATIAGFIMHGANVVDVGTDHGYLPIYLAQNGLANRIIASDISSGSISSALITAAKYKGTEGISFIVAPGLSGVGETEVDTVVISGLGGETISAILADAPWTKCRNTRLILQPQSKTGKLCSWLREHGYAISDAKLVREKSRLYVVMLAMASLSGSTDNTGAQSGETLQDSIQAMFGDSSAEREVSPEPMTNSDSIEETELLTALSNSGDPLFMEYIDRLISKAFRALEGMARSGAGNVPSGDAPGIANARADGYALMVARLKYLSEYKKQFIM